MKNIISPFISLNEKLKRKKGIVYLLILLNILVFGALLYSVGVFDFISSIFNSSLHTISNFTEVMSSICTFFWVDLFHESIVKLLIGSSLFFFAIMLVLALMRFPLVFAINLNKD